MTHYAQAWEDYKNTPEYKHTVAIMIEKNMKQPYIDNIIRGCFDAGYNSKPEIKS